MIAPRRFLPSTSSLLALEAVDRLGTATAAADELSLTHSAVSRQLKVLEDQIGVTMFLRDGRRLSLTSAGVAYAQSVRDCLQDLARASLRLKASGSHDTVALAIYPTFGMYWLAPRLRDFADAHPDIYVNQSTRNARVDFSREKFDAAIHYGVEDWEGVNYLHLAHDRVIPVCAPNLLQEGPLAPQDISRLPLLHLESRPGAWEQWFEHVGLKADRLRGMLFDQFISLAEAAVLGQGVALVPEVLARAEIARGRLVAAWPDYLEVEGSYYLVWSQEREPSPALLLLIGWLEKGRS